MSKDTDWNQHEAEELVLLVQEFGEDWDGIGIKLQRPADDCRELYQFFTELDHYFDAIMSDSGSSSGGKKRKRQRRKASLIERKFKCHFRDCVRAYGTQAALKYHIKNKHGNEPVPPPLPEVNAQPPGGFMYRPPMMFMPDMGNGMQPGFMPPMPGLMNLPPHMQGFPFPEPGSMQIPHIPMSHIHNHLKDEDLVDTSDEM